MVCNTSARHGIPVRLNLHRNFEGRCPDFAQDYYAFDLRLCATTNYVVQHMDAGLRDIGKWRDTRYLGLVRRLFFGQPCFLGKTFSWIIYTMSASGRFFVHWQSDLPAGATCRHLHAELRTVEVLCLRKVVFPANLGPLRLY